MERRNNNNYAADEKWGKNNGNIHLHYTLFKPSKDACLSMLSYIRSRGSNSRSILLFNTFLLLEGIFGVSSLFLFISISPVAFSVFLPSIGSTSSHRTKLAHSFPCTDKIYISFPRPSHPRRLLKKYVRSPLIFLANDFSHFKTCAQTTTTTMAYGLADAWFGVFFSISTSMMWL